MPTLAAIIALGIALALWSIDQEKKEDTGLPPHPLGPFVRGDRIIIIGLPMSGKTHLAAKLTKECPRVLYFDPFHDYRDAAKATEISSAELIAHPETLHRSTFRYSVIPDEDNLGDDLESVVKIARAAGDLVFVMDEVGDYKQEGSKTMEKLARNGRHNGIVPFYVSQVAMDIPRTVRRLATQVYSFRQEDVDDLDALSERYGEPFAKRVSNLPQHRYALWHLTGFGRTMEAKQEQSLSDQSQDSLRSKHSGKS